ncbi:MAG: putative porin [Ferruginibacter sp.]|nr:hypothetical protein [Ferruginibacter sp.]
MKKILISFLFCISAFVAICQDPTSIFKNRIGGIKQASSNSGNKNSSDTTKKKNNNKLDTLGFERRDDLADSITISYRYMDSVRRYGLDSSINDFDNYFPVSSAYQYLGNNGAAAFPLIFKSLVKIGFDAGFLAYDVYKFKLEDTKFYKTNGPFSMLGYQLASGKEQMIQALHTQNPKKNINVGVEYRLISAPGRFLNQNNNHNNIRLFSTYQGKRKRYNASFVVISNSIKASENGGIVADSLLLSPEKKERNYINVLLGNSNSNSPNPFKSGVSTGHIYKERILFYRHSYDIGKKDSVAVNDSTTEYLFYPKLRIQHTLTLQTNTYEFKDNAGDSALYRNSYGLGLKKKIDSFDRYEKWKLFTNDFSLISFPDTKNAAQFILAGISLQTIQGTAKFGAIKFYNAMLHGEYRNRTRNKLWDMILKGEFYLNGNNTGDYNIQAAVGRVLNKKMGAVNLYFSNVNRTPSFIFDARSMFNIDTINTTKKENITTIGGTATNKYLTLSVQNILINNFAYFSNFHKNEQYAKPINILQIMASKKIRLKKNIYYYGDVILQKTDKAAAIKLPLIYTRSRVAYEGSLYKNLLLSAGIEMRYYTAYKANNYAPITGQFTPQDTMVIKNLPDISAFLHFRIRSFAAYLRAENLNTMSFKNGFGFVNNNFAAIHYPTQGFMIRFGIKWWFVK